MTQLGATSIPLSLGDVLPAQQVGTLDSALDALQVFTALGYCNTTKYMNETGPMSFHDRAEQAVVRRRAGRSPSNLLTTAQEIEREVTPWELDFLLQQRKTWAHKGRELIALSPAEKADLI